jgi:FkbM family methyltransferase
MSAGVKTHSTLAPRGFPRLALLFNFSRRRGAGLREKIRLFYHAYAKPSLAFRGLARYHSERLLRFEIRAARANPFQVWTRDSQMDLTTFVEFFSEQHIIIPEKLPAYVPQVIYDIGANIGIASLYFAERYPAAQFFGFEPVPSNYEICKANYANLAKGQAFPWAVGAASGTATFEFDEADLRGGRLDESRTTAPKSARQQLAVTVVSIADLVAEKRIAPPDFIKIDVEGAELQVLAGIGPCLPHIKRMLIETHGPELLKQCLDWLKTNGFRVQDINEVAPGFAAVWADR